MASNSAPRMLGFHASAAIAKGKAVTLDATGQIVTAANAVTDKSIGVAQSDAVSDGGSPASFGDIEVAMPGGGGKGLLGGTVAAGDLLAPTTGGALIATTTENDRAIAMALEAGVSGDVIAVEVLVAVL